ncbi:hypothetical protein [Chromobacterium violaceum]|uniref:hypothetical protein n=1 Tax=Chromobacterium violaceum TaxID=536 RepID=UPI000304A574|nr:hypothetical protein [Chromobacterium violaceum]MBP4051615.1 hypothetical protein [Chromobacterium violaceum]QIY79558.1 hypothetical protein FOB43_10315 [Chromobacterium violaceum]SUX40727.1 Uncharacterised protein [Chromobacterium violaceum]
MYWSVQQLLAAKVESEQERASLARALRRRDGLGMALRVAGAMAGVVLLGLLLDRLQWSPGEAERWLLQVPAVLLWLKLADLAYLNLLLPRRLWRFRKRDAA